MHIMLRSPIGRLSARWRNFVPGRAILPRHTRIPSQHVHEGTRAHNSRILFMVQENIRPTFSPSFNGRSAQVLATTLMIRFQQSQWYSINAELKRRMLADETSEEDFNETVFQEPDGANLNKFQKLGKTMETSGLMIVYYFNKLFGKF